jgi:ESS family glutamate:Na+ symporter
MEKILVNNIWQFRFDMFQSVALGAIMYYFGVWMRSKIPALVKYSIPAPAIGGLTVAVIMVVLHAHGIASFAFDNTLQTVFMMCFFCTVGMNASYKLVLRGGIMVVAFWAVSTLVSVMQNAVGIPVAAGFGLTPLMGIIGGSVPMIGGLGTAGAFGALFEDEYAVSGALSAAIACATFGMVAGSIIGGPVGEMIIKIRHIVTPGKNRKPVFGVGMDEDMAVNEDAVMEEVGDFAQGRKIEDEREHKVSGPHLMKNLSWILIAVGFGSAFSYYLKKAGITLPPYLGAMAVAIIIRNVGDKSKLFVVNSKSVGMIGDIALGLYITMAINSLQLAQLVNLALPLAIMMAAQVVLIILIAYFLVFLLFGRNYDATVMASGLIGFGLGATPNALVCMQAITAKYGPSEKAFFVVPIVGAFLVDISNATVIAIITGFFR